MTMCLRAWKHRIAEGEGLRPTRFRGDFAPDGRKVLWFCWFGDLAASCTTAAHTVIWYCTIGAAPAVIWDSGRLGRVADLGHHVGCVSCCVTACACGRCCRHRLSRAVDVCYCSGEASFT